MICTLVVYVQVHVHNYTYLVYMLSYTCTMCKNIPFDSLNTSFGALIGCKSEPSRLPVITEVSVEKSRVAFSEPAEVTVHVHMYYVMPM